MLSFLYPAFLIGVAAAAIPVLLHLLRNEQAPELRFGAVRLLRGVKVEHAQRRRIRDWLLLALRAAALLLLAFAFARPYLPGRQVASGGATVILLDRSASMAMAGVWPRAREAVRAEIDRTPPGEALALIAFDDRPDVLVQPTLDRTAAKAAIERLAPGVGGTRYQPALARAVSVLDEADAQTGRVVVISDLQGGAADARATIPEAIRLDLVAIPSPSANLAVLSAHRTGGSIVAALRNDGPSAARVRVRLDAGGQALAEVPADLPPAQTVEVALPARLPAGDMRVALAAPDPSGLTADDVHYLEVDPADKTRVLVVSNSEGNFYIDAALRAGDQPSDFEVATARVQGLTAALAKEPLPEVVFLVGPRGLDRGGRDALVRFARRGGGVFIGASEALNEAAFAPLVEGMDIAVPRGDDPVLTLGAVEARHPVFQRLGLLGDAMGAARFTRAWRVRAAGWQVLARFDDGAGALFERPFGVGRVLFFASDVNRDWNDLPLQTSFVPFVHEIARYLAPQKSQGEYTPGTLPSEVETNLGFVRLPSGRRVVVNADPRESDPARMGAGEFASAVRRRGERRLDSGAAMRRAQVAEQGQGLWRP
jgi:hypothetical protein